jgi:hypothetical protein
MMEGQERRDEGSKNRRRANVTDDRDALAQFGAGEAAHRQQNDRHQNIGRYGPGGGEPANHRKQNQENRQRHDADLEINDRPPAFRPKAFGIALPNWRRVLGVLHLTPPQCCGSYCQEQHSLRYSITSSACARKALAPASPHPRTRPASAPPPQSKSGNRFRPCREAC